MAEYKISYTVNSVVTLDEFGEGHLIALYSRVKSGELSPNDAPPGIAAAVSKLRNDAPRDTILRTILGETTGLIIQEEIPLSYPPGRYGFTVRIAPVEYMETPDVLDPPFDVTPLVITPGSRTVQ